jgi:hypothetical protein
MQTQQHSVSTVKKINNDPHTDDKGCGDYDYDDDDDDDDNNNNNNNK